MYTYVVPCLLGLEKLVGDECRRLGLQDVRVENGRVLCRGTLEDKSQHKSDENRGEDADHIAEKAAKRGEMRDQPPHDNGRGNDQQNFADIFFVQFQRNPFFHG